MANDVARAARLAAAMAAEDVPGVGAVIEEAKRADGLVGLALALAARHIQICAEWAMLRGVSCARRGSGVNPSRPEVGSSRRSI
ncbi:hypothetical protein MBOE_06580 [Mycolicibacterium boenickei]|uniref:Uncharacterized protein n=1 Tax=Mycolicibacterium boenickei TaxID=146017 RepID=A0ABN5Z7M1_9MYCO|nr:hypothetical protein MBOE_06580 [Mycolicibacterium boenickei]